MTTHVLDTAHGRPAAGLSLRLIALSDTGTQSAIVKETRTNADGRCDAPLLGEEEMMRGRFRLEFAVGDYFKSQGVALPDPPFLDVVALEVGIADPDAHYHVPLLVSPFGYSTYRGS